jgi:hypothetical protein
MFSSTGEPRNFPAALNDGVLPGNMNMMLLCQTRPRQWFLLVKTKTSLIVSGFITSNDVLMVLLVVTKHS